MNPMNPLNSINPNETVRYLYSYACHESEAELCSLELRTLFPGLQLLPDADAFIHGRRLDPSRSPFLKLRLDIRVDAGSRDELLEQASGLSAGSRTFRVRYAKTGAPGQPDNEGRLALERQLGMVIHGEPDLRQPDTVFGAALLDGRWLCGEMTPAEPVWLRQNGKPRQYSTALPARAARAAVNIAVPEIGGIRAVDPCCGIGTVLLEALSMGIDIRGGDLNPLAAVGARENLRHFGYPESLVEIADMRSLQGHYDAALLDMPYNLCSVSPPEEQLEMLSALRRLAGRAVILTTEPIEPLIAEAGFYIAATCRLTKGNFVRLLHLCF
jgi:tRNA (guanine10-N2)-dimethyltransferase